MGLEKEMRGRGFGKPGQSHRQWTELRPKKATTFSRKILASNQWRRSLRRLGRSRMLKKLKNAEKVKRGPTDRRTDIAGCRVA